MVASPDAGVAEVLARLAVEGAELEANNRARSTRRAYAGDFAHFAAWCATVGTTALPASAEAVYLYLTVLVADANAADYSASTLERRLAAITYVHEVNGHGASPARHVKVRELMAGIRRTYAKAQARRDPLTTAQLAAMVAALDCDTLAAKRDRAVLLVGYAGAFRRAELASLTLAQLERRGDGYVVSLARTKTDQEARGRIVGLPEFTASPLCPVAALDSWLSAAEICQGPLFRRVSRYGAISASALSPASVALIVKRCALAAGIPASRLAGHSLRAGHATTAAANGAPDRVIMRQTGHRSVDTLEGYIRPGQVLVDNSARYLDLENP
jgi:site-specific recombinase XerD